MILVPVDELQPGMRLARSVYDGVGRTLLACGVRLHERAIRQLERLGYSHVYVCDDQFNDVEVPEIVGEAVKKQVSLTLKRVMPGLAGRSDRLMVMVDECVDILVEQVVSTEKVVVAVFDIRSAVDHTFSHSVGVAILSLLIAKTLWSSGREELTQIAKGAILHDIGKMRIPDSILSKRSGLTDREFEVVKSHTFKGYEILSDLLGRESSPARIALQHHERWNGSGYPYGLKGEEVSLYARLCGVCDVYDAMTTDRPYKGPVHPYEALGAIREGAGTLYDPRMVDSLMRIVAPYPPGTLVELDSGEVAIVTRLTDDLARPTVKVIKNPQHEFYRSFRSVDLSKVEELSVRRPITWHEVMSPRPWPRPRWPGGRTGR